MSLLMRILIFLVAGYILLTLLMFLLQHRMVYYPHRQLTHSPADIGLPYREITFETGDGLTLHGWLVGEEKPDKPVLLFCHGNAGNISHRLDSFHIFNHLGLTTLIFDYRGYGKSQGKPSEKGTYLDVQAAWRYLTEKESILPGQIILFGRSLGGAVAANLAAFLMNPPEKKPRALILESTFTSVPDVGAQAYPFLPVRLLARIRYDTLKLLPGIKIPVLVIHGDGDEIIPYSHGLTLYEHANPPKQFLKIHGSHNEGFLNSREIYIHGLDSFLQKTKSLDFPSKML